MLIVRWLSVTKERHRVVWSLLMVLLLAALQQLLLAHRRLHMVDRPENTVEAHRIPVRLRLVLVVRLWHQPLARLQRPLVHLRLPIPLRLLVRQRIAAVAAIAVIAAARAAVAAATAATAARPAAVVAVVTPVAVIAEVVAVAVIPVAVIPAADTPAVVATAVAAAMVEDTDKKTKRSGHPLLFLCKFLFP